MTRENVLFQLLNADMQKITDQPFNRMFTGNIYAIQNIIGIPRSGVVSPGTRGGIYDGPGKTGNLLLAANHSWVFGVGNVWTAVLTAAATDKKYLLAPVLSLTVGSITPCVGDVFIYGYDLS